MSLLFIPSIPSIPIAASHDPYFSSVILLCHFDGTNGSQTFVDSSSFAHTFNAAGGTTVLTTTAPLFGTACLNAPGTSTPLQTTSNNDYNLGSGDWTIELAYKTATPAGSGAILDFRTSVSQLSPDILIDSGSFSFFVNGSQVIIGGTVATSTFQRVALSKNSGTTRMYVNGTQVGSNYTDSNNYSISNPFVSFGASFNNANHVACNIDEVRVTKGVGRYPSNYTVATSAFPNF